jgi:hypothetical protein
MKKIFLAFLSLVIAATVIGQNDSLQPPYKRFPFFPPVKLLLPDSTSYFTKQDLDKKKAVMVMVFNPQCDHCQHETEELVKNIDKFSDIQIIMSTSMHFDSMLHFRERYQLAKYSNIVVAQDFQWFFATHYMLHNLPFLAFYNKKKELISVFEGSLPITAILEVFKE